MNNTNVRKLYDIATEVYADWVNVNYAAKPYLEAMATLAAIDEDYGFDTGRSMVIYFLSNAQTWRGEVAKRIKVELHTMLKS